jgi:hypothetical protein
MLVYKRKLLYLCHQSNSVSSDKSDQHGASLIVGQINEIRDPFHR